MGNIVKKRDPAVFVSPILSAFSSIIYVTKKLSSEDNEQDSKIEEQVKEIRKQESSYISELETSIIYSKNKIGKRKISVGKVENVKKIQSAKIKNINEKYNEEEREKRI